MKKKSTTSKRKISKVLGIDYLDFSFSLNLTEEELSIFNIDLESINTKQDLEFISKNESLLEKITVSSDSDLINSLLYLNKSNKFKCYVEFWSFNSFDLTEEEQFFKKIISYVTEHNFLFVNETQIAAPYKKISFKITVKGVEKKSFFFGWTEEDQRKEDEKKEEQEKKEAEEAEKNLEKEEKTDEEALDSENKDNKENEEKAEGENTQDKQEKSQRTPEEFVSSLQCDFANYENFVIDINKIMIRNDKLCPKNVTFDEILSLLDYLNKTFPKLKIVLFYPSILSNISLVDYNILTSLNAILSMTDVYLFDKKEAVALFNLINQLNNPNFKEEKGRVNETQLERLFLGSFEIKKLSSPKTAIFLDDFTKAVVIEICKHQGTIRTNTTAYQLDLYPKVNHTNQKLIDEYKKHIAVNKDFLKSIFFGTFLSRYAQGNSLCSSITSGSDLTKRILDLFKLELAFPTEQEFYLVTTKKANQSETQNKNKEQNFKLDCININRSKLNVYNPLKDNNLYSFFSSNIIRKHLKDAGFINTKGFLLEDPEKGAHSPTKSNNYLDSEREKKLLLAIKENEKRTNIQVKKNLINKSKVLHDSSIKELEKQARIKDYTKEYHTLLPSYQKSNRLKPIKGYSSLVTSKSINHKVSHYN